MQTTGPTVAQWVVAQFAALDALTRTLVLVDWARMLSEEDGELMMDSVESSASACKAFVHSLSVHAGITLRGVPPLHRADLVSILRAHDMLLRSMVLPLCERETAERILALLNHLRDSPEMGELPMLAQRVTELEAAFVDMAQRIDAHMRDTE